MILIELFTDLVGQLSKVEMQKILIAIRKAGKTPDHLESIVSMKIQKDEDGIGRLRDEAIEKMTAKNWKAIV